MHTLLSLAQLPVDTLLASAGTTTSTATDFFSSGFGRIIQGFFKVVGVLVVILTIGRSIKSFADGKMGDVAKKVGGGLIAAVVCFNLALPFQLIGGATDIITSIFSTITETINTNK